MTPRRSILVTSLALAARAHAEAPPAPDVQAHIDAGVAAFNAKDYATASSEFEAAYALAAVPKLLFAWAQARRLGGHCDDALPLYRRYLATKPSDEQIEAATTAMLLCERANTPPPPAPIVITRSVVAHEPEPWYRDRVGGVLVAAGVASLAAGVTFFVLASHSEDAANAAQLRADFVSLLDETTLRRRIGWAGIGVGSGLLIGGIARYLLHEPTKLEVAATSHSVEIVARF